MGWIGLAMQERRDKDRDGKVGYVEAVGWSVLGWWGFWGWRGISGIFRGGLGKGG